MERQYMIRLYLSGITTRKHTIYLRRHSLRIVSKVTSLATHVTSPGSRSCASNDVKDVIMKII
jgi:hypothetical protein